MLATGVRPCNSFSPRSATRQALDDSLVAEPVRVELALQRPQPRKHRAELLLRQVRNSQPDRCEPDLRAGVERADADRAKEREDPLDQGATAHLRTEK